MGECSRLVHQSAGHRVTLFAKLLRERERERGRKRGREEERKRVSATTINKKVTVPKRNTIIILNDKMFR